MLRLLDLCPYWTTPPRGGGQLRVHNINSCLSEWCDVEQWSFRPTLNDLDRLWPLLSVVSPSSHYTEVQVFSIPILSTAWLASRMRLNPDAFVSILLRTGLHRRLERVMRSADAVQLEHPWMFDYATTHTPEETPLVLMAHNIEHALLAGQAVPPSRSLLRRVRILEERAIAGADGVVAVSKDDALQLSVIGNRKDIVVAPHGVDSERFRPVAPRLREVRKRQLGLGHKRIVIFAGGMHYPNIGAARIIRDLASEFESDGLSFVVLGRAAHPSEARRNFHPLGFVPDVLPYYEAADYAVNPLTSGSGSSLKMLEFLAMGLPTVTTPVGARGLNLHDGREALVRDVSDFSVALRECLDDPELAKCLAIHGRTYVETHHSWKESARAVAELHRNLVDGGFRQ